MKFLTWKSAIFPVIAITFLAIYPQLSLFLSKGSNWHGSYFVSNYDETAYSAYVNAIANGKPRRFDPYLDRETEFESLYSIQFIPAYTIAIPERLTGISTPTAFMILIVMIGIFSAISLFFLIRAVTGDDLLASAGTIAILCFGTAAAFQGELRWLLEGRILVEYLPFLRRYQPGLAFPLFFVFALLVWQALNADSRKASVIYSLASGLLFAVLVFSYFYIWTAAAAWFGCVSLIWLLLNRDRSFNLVASGIIVGLCAAFSLLIYFTILGMRSANIDNTQLLTLTRMPTFASPTLAIGLIVAAVIALMAWKGSIRLRGPAAIFALSFSFTPVILFNQQIFTGRSLQPAHYEIFISNYLVLTAAVLTLSLWMSSRRTEANDIIFRRALIYLALIATGWGTLEAVGASGRSAAAAVVRDESASALRYIKQKSKNEPLTQSLVVHATNFVSSDLVPTETQLRPLWCSHSNSVGSIDAVENKRLFYLYLYYSGFTEKDLGEMLSKNSFEITAAVFGSNRALPELAGVDTRVSDNEIKNEAQKYGEFVRSISQSDVIDPTLSWLIVPVKSDQNLSNIDRWYERSDEEEFGMFKVYKLTLK